MTTAEEVQFSKDIAKEYQKLTPYLYETWEHARREFHRKRKIMLPEEMLKEAREDVIRMNICKKRCKPRPYQLPS